MKETRGRTLDSQEASKASQWPLVGPLLPFSSSSLHLHREPFIGPGEDGESEEHLSSTTSCRMGYSGVTQSGPRALK